MEKILNQKRVLLVAGAALLVIALIVITVLVIRQRAAARRQERSVAALTSCEVNREPLCIVSFGADLNDRMLINFLVPERAFPLFYVTVLHGQAAARFDCRVVENFPESVYCSGPRTPLGEAIVIEVYSVDEQSLLARGTFILSAIALPTPVSVSVTPGSPTITPDGPADTPSPLPPPTWTAAVTVTATPLGGITPTSDPYPNP